MDECNRNYVLESFWVLKVCIISELGGNMKIAVIGAGYVGLVSAACFAELGHQVIAVDNDAAKIELLSRGKIPIHEQHLPDLLARHRGSGLEFSSDIRYACRRSDVIFICVGTPPSYNGEADLSYVEGVARELAVSLDKHKVIVEKSTVPVGTCEAVHRTILLYGASPSDFSIASNPEFLREGTAVMDFLCPDRILMGVSDEPSRAAMLEIYRPIIDGSYWDRPNSLKPAIRPAPPLKIVTSVKSAEMIKHASNSFLALKISFINSVANVCERVGADVREVAKGMGSDSRIGPRFLSPGIGYGGSCFPKDVLAFRSVAAAVGYDFSILGAVMEVNEDQRRRFVSKVREALWTLRGKRLAVLGLAFKGGTDDCRDSPAIDLVKRFQAEGSEIVAYDPAAMDRARTLLSPDSVRFATDAYEACEGADAVLILTEWPEFVELDWQRVKKLLRLPIVLDGKNLLQPELIQTAGLRYFGVGLPTSQFDIVKPPPTVDGPYGHSVSRPGAVIAEADCSTVPN
jgi:UDPglucose 6-dehydrogenase